MEFSIKGHIFQGQKTKPVIVFLHGLGLNSRIWTDMLNYRVLSGYVPIAALVQGHNIILGSFNYYNNLQQPKKPVTLWEGLKSKGFNLVCWSETTPFNSIVKIVKELSEVIKTVQTVFPGLPIALVGHSRGGIIARKFMEQNTEHIRALITISAPHKGSAIAQFGIRLSHFVRNIDAGMIKNRAMQGLIYLVHSQALHELYPGAKLLQCINDMPLRHIKYISFGGNNPFGFISVLKKHPYLAKGFNLITSSVFPDELIYGRGDGFVTDESARLPWTEHHYTLSDNHASILCNKTVEEVIVNALKEL